MVRAVSIGSRGRCFSAIISLVRPGTGVYEVLRTGHDSICLSEPFGYPGIVS